MRIQFTKMHGLGNDFMVVNAINQQVELTPGKIQQLADRHFGIGFDQLLLVEASQRDAVDFRYRIFNADGSEVEQCGNGARCFARYVRDKGLTDKQGIVVETMKGLLTLHVEENDQITVNMGIPDFEPATIPFVADERSDHYLLHIVDQAIDIGVVALGNPHAVTLCDDIYEAAVNTLGPLIEKHERFPRRVNAGFLQIDSRNEAHVRVFERGAGETLACGSGACAAVVIGRLWNLLDESVQVHLPGGTLNIVWQGEGNPVMMSGPAETVYEGSIEL